MGKKWFGIDLSTSPPALPFVPSPLQLQGFHAQSSLPKATSPSTDPQRHFGGSEHLQLYIFPPLSFNLLVIVEKSQMWWV